jgi:hypothetical protein
MPAPLANGAGFFVLSAVLTHIRESAIVNLQEQETGFKVQPFLPRIRTFSRKELP